ncbi:MAG: GNAT family N-acetyltransferase [Novosphingobium sp.]|jgi:L-amino acid N-acyltransferase YncA|uniref:GNAT family N-acetyltransferase n=1 Tax=Novosphingobium sp. TaxID=1874826 RepID=UPI00391CB496
MQIRPARPDDCPAIADIYAHHVLHGTASYETEPPDTAEMTRRMDRVLGSGWPWLVAEQADGTMLGYAYATQFRDRAAYRFVCEDSIYIRDAARGQGVGKVLLAALIEACTAAGFRQMVAVIGGAEPASEALHARLGFTLAGRLSGIGRKQGRWLDTLYMQRALGQGSQEPPAFEPS